MANKKDDLDFEYEDEDEVAEDDEYGEEDADDDDDEFDEDEDDEEGGKRGGGMVKVAILAVLFLGAVGAGAFAFMSSGGGLGFLSGVPVVGSFFAKPTPVPASLPSGFANPNLETRKPATASGAAAGADPAALAAKAAADLAKGTDQSVTELAKQAEAARLAAQQAAGAVAGGVETSDQSQTMGADPEWPATATEKTVKKVEPAKKSTTKAAAKKKTRWRKARSRPRTSSSGPYSVQVGAFSEPANAQRLIASLKSQGYPAYGSGGGGTGGMFKVRSNVVDSRQKANQLANQFRLAGWNPRIVPLSGSNFVLHLGTFNTQEQANNLVADLNAKGLFATVSGRVGSPGGTSASTPNRVWVGKYSNRSEAEAMASKLKAAVGAAIVVRK